MFIFKHSCFVLIEQYQHLTYWFDLFEIVLEAEQSLCCFYAKGVAQEKQSHHVKSDTTEENKPCCSGDSLMRLFISPQNFFYLICLLFNIHRIPSGGFTTFWGKHGISCCCLQIIDLYHTVLYVVIRKDCYGLKWR